MAVDDSQALESRFLDNGATSVVPVEKQFWGTFFGIVRDVRGVYWSLDSTPDTPPRHEIPRVNERSLVPSLVIDKCEEYIEWLTRVIPGAEVEQGIHLGPDGTVMHAEINVNRGLIYVSDAKGQIQGENEPGIVLMLQTDTGMGKAIQDRAVAAGGKTTMPVELQFWGDVYGEFTDPVDDGIKWALIEESKMSKREREKYDPAPGTGNSA